jgi:stress response protein YsnF
VASSEQFAGTALLEIVRVPPVNRSSALRLLARNGERMKKKPPDPDEGQGADATTLPVNREVAEVSTREVVTGRVRVDTTTDVIEKVVQQELQVTQAEVIRVPVNRTLDAGETPPEPRIEGDVTIIPIFEEIVLVQKRLVLKEELHITQSVNVEKVEVPVTLRKQRVTVNRLQPDDA